MSAIQQLLTDHIDIWTAAETEKKSARGRASGNASSVYGITKLRELILELAVRGKLVPQNAKDEPAVESLMRIQNSRVQLLAEGKIKKNKLHAPITEKDKPFAIPNGWEWVRLGDVLYMLNGRAFKPTDWTTEGLPIVRIQNLNNSQALFNYCNESSVDARHVINNGSFLISWSGTPGTSFGAFIWRGGKAALNQHIFSCFQIGQPYFDEFLELAINTRLEELIAKAHGAVGLQHVTKGKLEALTLVLPSISEQQRIVTKVNELMGLCDQLEAQHTDAADAHELLVSHLLSTLTQSQNAADFNASWQRIAVHFDTLFTTEASIDTLKKTLLQLAVMGKLVTQDAKDEPASELLKRIQAEKIKLIEAGKIKKDKPTLEIGCQEMAFQVPEGWTWARMINCSSQITDGEHLTPQRTSDSTQIPLVTAKNVRDGSIDYTITDFVDIDVAKKCWKRCKPELNDILIVSVGATIGRLAIIEAHCDMVIVRSVTLVKPLLIDANYLSIALRSPLLQKQIWSGVKQNAQPGLYLSVSQSLPIPLPPLPEQRRIVAMITELMQICEKLRSGIATANRQHIKLANVFVERAVLAHIEA